MRILRGIGGAFLMLLATLAGGFACLEAGALHEWDEFSAGRLLEAKSIIWTLGCLAFAVMSILTARSGKASPNAVLGGVVLGLFGVAVGVHAIVIGNKHPLESLPYAVVSLVLCVASSPVLAGHREAAAGAASSTDKAS